MLDKVYHVYHAAQQCVRVLCVSTCQQCCNRQHLPFPKKTTNKCLTSYVTAESHMIKILLLEALIQLPVRGIFSHACSTYPFHSRVVENIDLWCRTPVWAQAEPSVSGCESIFNCCPPQVQRRLPDIADMCRSWTFSIRYLYLQAVSVMAYFTNWLFWRLGLVIVTEI